MALFRDFSFSEPASEANSYDDLAPLEDYRRSRSSSPSSYIPMNKRLSISDSLYDYTSLNGTSSSSSSISSQSTIPISARLLGADRRKNSLAREYFETIRARRQCAIRQQCDPRRASAIRIYVENLLSEEASYELHPSSVGMSFPSPTRSTPNSFCEGNLSSTSTEDEEDEVEAMKGLSIVENSSKQRSGVVGSSFSRKRHSVQKSTRTKTKSRARY